MSPTPRTTRPVAAIAAALALTLGLAACGSSDDDKPTASASSPSTTPSTTAEPSEPMTATVPATVMPMGTGDPFADARTAAGHMPETAETLATGFVTALKIPGAVDSPAADLRSGLTALLQEHVYLAGIAVATAYVAGADSAEFKAAAATLDGNTVDLSKAVGQFSTPKQEAAFLTLWRTHIGYFVDYAVAAKGADAAGKKKAVKELMGYTKDAGAFFETISHGKLPAGDIAAALEMHITTLTKAIDDLATGSDDAYADLHAAAAHVGEGAAVIAGGLAASAGLEGDASDKASTLRAELTATLQEHVYLASVAVFTAYTTDGGTDSSAFGAAAAALDGNSVALSQAVGSLAGDDKGAAFLDLWREHIGYFVDYAAAIAKNDDSAGVTALTSLDAYRGEAGEFFSEISDGALPADAVASGLAMHVQTLAGAIDSLNEALVQKG